MIIVEEDARKSWEWGGMGSERTVAGGWESA